MQVNNFEKEKSKKIENDVVVVGAGLSGLTAARTLAENGKKVLIIEKREFLGGNVFDFEEGGIRIQKYGPHIFHTSDKRVYEFLSRFTEWMPYTHKVLANVDGKLVPVPFDLNSLEMLFERGDAAKLKSRLVAEYGMGARVPVFELTEHRDPEIRRLGGFVYNKVFYFYTFKQWGRPPEELGEAVRRVPVSVSYDDGYFADRYQLMPTNGFSALCEAMADHPNIKIATADALDCISLKGGTIRLYGEKFGGDLIYTGRLDDLLGRKYGLLEYRSLDFAFETHDTPSFQPAAVVNYTTSEQFTRISEFTKFACRPCEKTVTLKEFPKSCRDGDEPFYPVPSDENEARYKLYASEAENYPSLHLLGRLATYKYVNMDAAVRCALDLCDRLEATWTD